MKVLTIDSLKVYHAKVKNLLNGKANSSHTHTKSEITNFPTSLPASDVYPWAKASTKPSYSWSEISNTPTIPTVGNGTVTVNQGGAKKGSFTLNQSGNVTIDLTDNNTTYGKATNAAYGLVKIGYTATGKNYPVQLDSDGKAYVNVPWTDTNTVYTHPTTSGNKHIPSGGSSGQILRWSADGTAVWGSDNNTTYGAASSSTYGLIKIGYTASGKNYPVQLDSNGKAYVNVPWTDTDTNTWRGIQNNLTSTSTTESLSANQGKVLKELVDGKQNKSTVVTGTLSSGSTSITLSNSAITTDSTIDFYTSIYGVNPKTVSVSSGSITLTFDAQSSDMGVKVVIL